MDYFKQRREFRNRLSNEINLSTGQILLYIQLLDYANDEHHLDESFKLKNSILESLTGLTRQGLYTARNRLAQENLIEVAKGKKDATAPSYKIIKLYREKSKNVTTELPNSLPPSYSAVDHGVATSVDHRVDHKYLLRLDSNKTKTKTRASQMHISDFEKLWNLYPKKVGKKPALAAYKRAVTRQKEPATNKQIQDGIIAYKRIIADEGIDSRYVKDGSTFFNQESWQDYTAIASEKQEEAQAKEPKFDPREISLMLYRNSSTPEEVTKTIKREEIPLDPKVALRYISEYQSEMNQTW